MKTIRLKTARDPKEIDALAGTFLDGTRYVDHVVSTTTKVIRPDGSVLAHYIADALDSTVCAAAWGSLRLAANPTTNRGIAAGRYDTGKARAFRIRQDGKRSKTNQASAAVESGVVGFFDRYPRIPFCRRTAFTAQRATEWQAAQPFIRAVDAAFRQYQPGAYGRQRAIADRTHADFVIRGTAFTTLTVNRNFQTAVHKDAGDYREGFGVLSALRAGEPFTGGLFVLPRYGVAIDMQTGGVLLADVHEWHGNTPMVGPPGRWERISCVFYYRANMHRCGSAADELERARRGPTGRMWDEG